jgi:hypothetical protein
VDIRQPKDKVSHREQVRPANRFGVSVSRTDGQTTVREWFRVLAAAIRSALSCDFVEPMTGIEPAYSAWEAISSAERLSESA